VARVCRLWSLRRRSLARFLARARYSVTVGRRWLISRRWTAVHRAPATITERTCPTARRLRVRGLSRLQSSLPRDTLSTATKTMTGPYSLTVSPVALSYHRWTLPVSYMYTCRSANKDQIPLRCPGRRSRFQQVPAGLDSVMEFGFKQAAVVSSRRQKRASAQDKSWISSRNTTYARHHFVLVTCCHIWNVIHEQPPSWTAMKLNWLSVSVSLVLNVFWMTVVLVQVEVPSIQWRTGDLCVDDLFKSYGNFESSK